MPITGRNRVLKLIEVPELVELDGIDDLVTPSSGTGLKRLTVFRCEERVERSPKVYAGTSARLQRLTGDEWQDKAGEHGYEGSTNI
jgi:hypothetical protein